MLNALRKRAGSWIVKVLLMLLVVSFAVWGIGDVFYGGGNNPEVAQVGNSEITANELNAAFNRVVDNFSQQIGSPLEREQAIQFGLMQQALQQLIMQRLIDLEATAMGLTVADATLRELITQTPAFQVGGRFDRSRFEQLLYANGLTEESYLALIRQEVLRSSLTESLAAPISVPEPLVEHLYRYRNEERTGRMLVVRQSEIEDLGAPSDADLDAILAANEARFTTPEYRALTFVTLEPEDLLEEVQVSEEEIAAAYEARLAQYVTPARRHIVQLLAPDQASAEEAARRAADGTSLTEVAAAMAGQQIRVEDLGTLSPGDLPGGLGEAAFAMGAGELSKPVESPFGWHLFRASEVQDEEVVPLAEARAELERELALEEARDRLPSLSERLDDELAAGLSIPDAAAALALEVARVERIDRQGRDLEGEPVAAVPSWPEFLATAFSAAVDEPSLVEETDAGSYFVLQVDAIEAPRLQEREEVRDELVALWQDEQRAERARAEAQAMLDQAGPDGSLGRVANQAQRSVDTIAAVKRDSSGDEAINAAVVQALFATAPGRLADRVIEVQDGFALVATDEVIAADPAAADLEPLRNELRGSLRNDLLQQFEAALRRDYAIEIDDEALARVMRNEQPAAGGSPMMPPGPMF